MEQPRVFDGDHGLGGEIPQKLDLLVAKRADFLAINRKRANQLVVLEHRYANEGSRAAEPRGIAGNNFSRVVGGVTYLLCPHHALEDCAWCRPTQSDLLIGSGQFGWRVVQRDRTIRVTLETEQRAELGLADAYRVLQHGVEDWPELVR